MNAPRPLLPGFTLDPEDALAGFVTDAQGRSRRVFVKRSRSLKRHAQELAALALIHKSPDPPPIPQLLSEFSDETGPVLVFSYEAGVNLADLLVPTPSAPPRPPWYSPTHLPRHPSIQALKPLLFETGQAVKALHAIRVDRFGKLVGEEPNPHRSNARAYTHQEFNHRLGRGLEKDLLSPMMERAIADWLDREITCLSESEPPCLIHNDLHAGNVRVYSDADTGCWRLRSLIDFELAIGWLPEYDLAILHLDLNCLANDTGPASAIPGAACERPGAAWESFLAGYGPVDPVRLRLFEALRALTGVAYGDLYPAWRAWGLAVLKTMIDNRASGW